MKKHRIWILNREDRLRGYQYVRLEEEGIHLGLEIEHIVAEDFQILEPLDAPGYVYHNGKYRELPDAIITRQTGMTYHAHSLLRYFQHQGVKVMNTSQAIENAEDKYMTTQLLSQGKVSIPRTVLLQEKTSVEYLDQHIGFPLVVKTTRGAKGDGVFLVLSSDEYEEKFQEIKKTAGNIPLIAQEFIASSSGRDLRVFVVGKKAIGCVQRSSADPQKQFKANIALGGTATYVDVTPAIEKIAVQSTKVLGLDIAGVDLLFTDTGYTVCEVNSSPSFEGFEKDAQVNVPKKILEHVVSEFT